MRVVLTPSLREDKKWRATFVETGKTVDFGQRGASDFTIHKDPHRMVYYLLRHGGVTKDEYAEAKTWTPARVLRHFRTRRRSTKEDWTDPHTPGFWSRWLLWSEPLWNEALRRTEREGRLRILVRRG